MRTGRISSIFYSISMANTQSNVHGINLDAQTRCAHYNKPEDVIAIKMRVLRPLLRLQGLS